jgi:hypothetical protein
MKKRSKRPARKAAKPRRKTIMRHSREGVKTRKPKRSAKAKRKTAPARSKRAASAKTASRSKPPRKGKPAATRSPAVTRKGPARLGRRRGSADLEVESPSDARGLGAESAGQSGDTEGLSREEEADSESVEELVEEGQAFEAGVISGVENARNPSRRGVRTRQVPEDDVPQEYLDED